MCLVALPKTLSFNFVGIACFFFFLYEPRFNIHFSMILCFCAWLLILFIYSCTIIIIIIIILFEIQFCFKFCVEVQLYCFILDWNAV